MKSGNELPGKRAAGLCYLPEGSSWDMGLRLDLKQCYSTFMHLSTCQPNSFSWFFGFGFFLGGRFFFGFFFTKLPENLPVWSGSS